ncbi:hypothetical protein PoB_005712000 [Plakobranchus ocellatus]|uniref:Uncharacterized protein n=1 Tax=Plakobranchus ocellatus TaxID=259542 RepID=A0AAV4CGH3_9GAST|nr:hypothetical protein PoB_005712000 [Plakobranchus ocellatus]
MTDINIRFKSPEMPVYCSSAVLFPVFQHRKLSPLKPLARFKFLPASASLQHMHGAEERLVVIRDIGHLQGFKLFLIDEVKEKSVQEISKTANLEVIFRLFNKK